MEFNQLAMANSEGSDHMLNRVMPKDNIGLAALLKTKEAAWDNGKHTVTFQSNCGNMWDFSDSFCHHQVSVFYFFKKGCFDVNYVQNAHISYKPPITYYRILFGCYQKGKGVIHNYHLRIIITFH